MDYFYEHESELFTFYRVPKVLFTEESFKNMNCEAKLLYGLLLDKMGLSRKSGWFDKQGRAFVYYGISHIMEDLGCAHSKAEKLLRFWFWPVKTGRRGTACPTSISDRTKRAGTATRCGWKI